MAALRQRRPCDEAGVSHGIAHRTPSAGSETAGLRIAGAVQHRLERLDSHHGRAGSGLRRNRLLLSPPPVSHDFNALPDGLHEKKDGTNWVATPAVATSPIAASASC
jgi:hypothetical protein